MPNLMIFDFVMKSGHVHSLATSATDEADSSEAAKQIIDNFSHLQSLTGYDPRTKRHWRIVPDDVAIIEAHWVASLNDAA